MEVNTKTLAECLGLTRQSLQRLTGDGIIVRVRRGVYDLGASVRGYIEYKLTAAKDGAASQSLESVKADHELLKMRKTELSVRLMEGKLHRAEDVERVMTQCAATVKSKMLAIPIKVSPEIAGLEDPARIQKILQREVADALNEVAEYDPADYADPTPMEDEEDDEESTGEEN